MKLKMKYFTLLTLSTLLMAVGIYFFKFSNNFTFGGITGLAVLVAKTGLISASDFSFLAKHFFIAAGTGRTRKRIRRQNSILYHTAVRRSVGSWNQLTL